jgi:iron complex outermembrane receptor protein
LGELLVFPGAAFPLLIRANAAKPAAYLQFGLGGPKRLHEGLFMFRSNLLRGVSAGALSFAVFSSSSTAQEALPAIDIDAERAPERPSSGEAPGSSQYGAGLGGRFTGYTVNFETPAVATKDNIPILQNPVSVQVVPREVMDDQQVISVADAIIGNVSSVQPAPDAYYDSFTIRGIPDASIFRENLKTPNIVHLQTANLQSIEVLKGPAAMLFGRLEPGGVVNLVVKRPLDTPYFSAEQQLGSWGLTRTTVDATAPLTQDKTWLYRVNLSFNHSDSFRNFVTNQDAFIAPTLRWRPSDRFRFIVDV